MFVAMDTAVAAAASSLDHSACLDWNWKSCLGSWMVVVVDTVVDSLGEHSAC